MNPVVKNIKKQIASEITDYLQQIEDSGYDLITSVMRLDI